jgi:16S rRNA (cytidine1402-2'-O)-methyltransferase
MPLTSPTRETDAGCLYVVATPIGNLEDITLRAVRTLKEVDLIAAEDTRHTRKLLAAHGIENQLISYHEHNEQQRTADLIRRLEQGTRIALVSDAGTPTVSDPGYRLVEAAAARRIPVVPIPGVSAATAALSAAGLPTDSFTFAGFPQRKKARRLEQLRQLAAVPHTLIFYQSPRRLTAFLSELKEIMGDRPAVLAREITKMHEEFLRGPLSRILAQLEQRPEVKGECTLLVSGAPPADPEPEDLDAAIAEALERSENTLSVLARELSRQWSVPRAEIYARALKIKSAGKSSRDGSLEPDNESEADGKEA